MSIKFIKKDYEALLHDLEEILRGKTTGFETEIDVGGALFPYRLPPVIQIVLLDPDETTIAFRSRSNPKGKLQKTGQWRLGTPAEAISFMEEWLTKMMEVKAGDEQIEIEEKK